jgi:hypothetical protein
MGRVGAMPVRAPSFRIRALRPTLHANEGKWTEPLPSRGSGSTLHPGLYSSTTKRSALAECGVLGE